MYVKPVVLLHGYVPGIQGACSGENGDMFHIVHSALSHAEQLVEALRRSIKEHHRL